MSTRDNHLRWLRRRSGVTSDGRPSHSASFDVEQLHSTAASMTNAAMGLSRLSRELANLQRKVGETALHKRSGAC